MLSKKKNQTKKKTNVLSNGAVNYISDKCQDVSFPLAPEQMSKNRKQ